MQSWKVETRKSECCQKEWYTEQRKIVQRDQWRAHLRRRYYGGKKTGFYTAISNAKVEVFTEREHPRFASIHHL